MITSIREIRGIGHAIRRMTPHVTEPRDSMTDDKRGSILSIKIPQWVTNVSIQLMFAFVLDEVGVVGFCTNQEIC